MHRLPNKSKYIRPNHTGNSLRTPFEIHHKSGSKTRTYPTKYTRNTTVPLMSATKNQNGSTKAESIQQEVNNCPHLVSDVTFFGISGKPENILASPHRGTDWKNPFPHSRDVT
ncbi:hypothetical protein JTE90_008016 [Oedothorax gibbosus]|uniref:Uncharacterized protein n=1 Tax=Oedothorax gibbosus TaxID=931172 RepID=A0AAV6UY62_9ARAC|nr:hypothetical protein JTE90_008016 [Oedothorax gibbosus]